jgi:hypothetical protein
MCCGSPARGHRRGHSSAPRHVTFNIMNLVMWRPNQAVLYFATYRIG